MILDGAVSNYQKLFILFFLLTKANPQWKKARRKYICGNRKI